MAVYVEVSPMKSHSVDVKSVARWAVLVCAVALAASTSRSQEAKMFVKVNPEICWTDTKNYVTTQARGAVANDGTHTIEAQRFANFAGDISLVVAALPAKDKKGEEGCEIIVNETGGGSLNSTNERTNALLSSQNLRAAQLIAAQVQAKQKQRDKDAKKADKATP
jgi:hypothetical protein